MRGLKFSKTALLILAAGAFIVVLGGLGVMRYGQMSEQEELNDALALSQTRLDNLDIQPLQVQLAELEEQLSYSEIMLEEAKDRLVQPVTSANVTDKFYEIADYHGIIVNNISTTKNQNQSYAGIYCLTIGISATVSGDLEHIIDFITGLNNNFSTGFLQSAQITIYDAAAEGSATANILMSVYTSEDY